MISFIVPTIGRPSLEQTLRSIQTMPGDEILVVGKVLSTQDSRPRYLPCENGHDSGVKERNIAMAHASGRYLAFIDDDDVYIPGARLAMHAAMIETPDVPVLFRMRYPNGLTLWFDREVRCGNVGTPMILVPNVPAQLGTWKDGGVSDFAFLSTMRWRSEQIAWREEIVAMLGHNT